MLLRSSDARPTWRELIGHGLFRRAATPKIDDRCKCNRDDDYAQAKIGNPDPLAGGRISLG
jgi:hypothetical protein